MTATARPVGPVAAPRGAESRTIALATGGLSLVALLVVLSIAFIAYSNRDVPDALASIGGGAVGALATMLTTFAPAPIVGGRRASDPPPEIPPTPPAPPVAASAVAGGVSGDDG